MASDEVLDVAFNGGVVVAILATVTSLGLSLTLTEILAPLRRVGLVSAVIVVNVVLIPAAAWGVTNLFGLTDDAISGITLAAIGAAGGAGLKAAQLSRRADLALAISLVIILQVLNLVAVPLWAGLVVRGASVEPVTLLRYLIALVLVPLIIGLVVRARWEKLASRGHRILVRIANVTMAIAILAGIVANLNSISDSAGARVVLASVAIVGLAVGAGTVLGGRDPATRATLGLVSGMRFAALGLIIIGTQLNGSAAVLGPAIVYALIDLVLAIAIAFGLARRTTRAADVEPA